MGNSKRFGNGLALSAMLLWPCLCQAEKSPQSQTWLNSLSATKTGTFTSFQFDEKGLVIQKKIYAGLDNSGKVISQTNYAFDASQRLLSETVTNSEALAAKVEYQYKGLIKPSLIIYKTLEGEEKFRDSLTYASDGSLKEQRSYKDQKLMVMHRYGYQSGNLVIDTSFENNGSGFIPIQGLGFSYDKLNRVIEKKHILWINGKTFTTHFQTLEYNPDGTLSHEREYEGLGPNAELVATASYTYNTQLLKFREEFLDGKGNPVSVIEYSWAEGVSAIRNLSQADRSKLAIKQIQGQYIPVSGNSLRLLDLRGRTTYSSQDINNGRAIRLTAPAILIQPKSTNAPQSSRSH